MQHMSSKNNEHLLHASELFDGQCRQFAEGDTRLLASREVKQHLNNWAIIGSALRGELPSKVDLNFADKVMERIYNEMPSSQDALPSILQGNNFTQTLENVYPGPQVDPEEDKLVQAANEQQPSCVNKEVHRVSKFFNLKRFGVIASQTAVAASVAVFAVIGIQTYNAADPSFESPVTAYSKQTSGANSGLSLASYQNSDSDIMVNLNQVPNISNNEHINNTNYQAQMQQKQKEELDRINNYVQGYVLEQAH